MRAKKTQEHPDSYYRFDPLRAQAELEKAGDERLKEAYAGLEEAQAIEDKETRLEAVARARNEVRDAREAMKTIRMFGPGNLVGE